MAERDLIERLDDAIEAIVAGRSTGPIGGLALAEPELATLLMVADDLRALPDPAFKSKLLAELIPPMEAEMTTNDFPSIRPYLLVPDADGMIAFLQETLGAELLGRYPDAEGRVMHAALRVGDSLIEMGEPASGAKPMALHIYLDDVDSAYERALAAGATSTLPITNQAYGDREGGVKDRWGNAWYLATHQEEVAEDELMQRFRGAGSKPQKQPGVGPRPEGYHTVTPFLHVRGARKMIAFLENAFGGSVAHSTDMPDREVAHAAVRIGDSLIELGEAHGESQPMPAAIHLFVSDVDAVYERALRAGATSVEAPADKPYGERGAWVIDPFENQWFIATAKG
ncbi:MAG TPA: VOC family protein [Thermoanaerobaculia bacterium]|jgi:PhnB protein|nr:VOC family protein [Thermoanaerobaculia bacterium]